MGVLAKNTDFEVSTLVVFTGRGRVPLDDSYDQVKLEISPPVNQLTACLSSYAQYKIASFKVIPYQYNTMYLTLKVILRPVFL